MASEHNKIITRAAKDVLQPLGLHQRGRSRTWVGDHGWWVAVVEFQPSRFEKASDLNVAAHWLWSSKGYISFDLGWRGDGHVRAGQYEVYESDEQFEGAAYRLATAAAEAVHELTARLPSIEKTADLLLGREAKLVAPHRGSWPTYNAGVAAGLARRANEADVLLRAVSSKPAISFAEQYIDLCFDAVRFRAQANSIIARQREALRLPVLSSEPF